MRFYIELICKKNEFPIDMRRVVLSIIKSSLTKVADGKYFDKYYEENNVKYKDFCFSVVLPIYICFILIIVIYLIVPKWI